MNFSAKNTQIFQQSTQCAVVFAAEKKLLTSAELADKHLSGTLSQLISSGDLSSNCGDSLWVALPAKDSKRPFSRLLFVQLGKLTTKHGIEKNKLRQAFARIANKTAGKKIADTAVYIDDLCITDSDTSNADIGQLLACEILRGHYRYHTTKKIDAAKLPALKKVIAVGGDTKQVRALNRGLNSGQALGDGINLARELGNLPGNICTPTYLSEQAKSLATNNSKVSVKIVGEKQMERLKMGSLLSVARGSEEEAKLIIIEYKGKPNAKPHVLVGKGITFDTGGISLKPGAGMDEMKFDMCGSASVLGTMHALIAMDAKVNAVAIIAAAENMPSGRATKPGDVVTSMSGQTIEVLNTDAEGRLVLCDALTYAERFKPQSVIDIATLTGACVIALGNPASGLYANDQTLADALLHAGQNSNDKAWQMPLWDEYQKQLDSNFADIANIGGREAGSVTAACFLSRFTKKYAWAHLDIAGTAWNSGSQKGATGRPVALLVDYLLNNS